MEDSIRSAKLNLKSVAIIVASILALTAAYVGAMLLAGAEVSAEPAPAGAGSPAAKHCKTVTPHVWNRYVRKLDRLTGRRHHKATRKVCKAKFYELKAKIRKARADCLRRAAQTEASVYWPGADSGGMIGSCGWYLGNYKYGFAELGMGRYMGGIPCGATVYVHGPNGRTVAAKKLDIGYGSGSPRRAIDLWNRTGPAIGIGNGIGQVTYSRRNCWTR